MEGVVDSVLRRLVTAEGGVDACVTEFVRVTHHLHSAKMFFQFCPELHSQSRTLSGTPVLVQLLGSDPQCMAENAALAVELGASGIDLNFGCPAKTVNNNDGGATLLKKPERLLQVISAVRKAVPAEVSVSAKTRLGFDHKDDVADIARACEAGGASWLTVHARTKTEAYKPPAHWEYIATMKESVAHMPILANGEIWSRADYERCREVSRCEHVMIGRGLISNPGLAFEIKNDSPMKPWASWQNFFLDFLSLSEQSRHASFAVQRSKQLAKMMGQTHGEARLLLEAIKRLENLADVKSVIENQWNLFAPQEPQKIVSHKLNSAQVENCAGI